MLRTQIRGQKKFQGDVNYDILSNRFYADAFQYQSMSIRNEPSDFEQSDMVLKVLYSGQSYQYIRPGQIKSTHFDSNVLEKQFGKIKMQTSQNAMANLMKKKNNPKSPRLNEKQLL